MLTSAITKSYVVEKIEREEPVLLAGNWSIGNAKTVGLVFNFRADQIGHMLPPLQISSKKAMLPRHNDAEMDRANLLHDSANTASKMKDLTSKLKNRPVRRAIAR